MPGKGCTKWIKINRWYLELNLIDLSIYTLTSDATWELVWYRCTMWHNVYRNVDMYCVLGNKSTNTLCDWNSHLTHICNNFYHSIYVCPSAPLVFPPVCLSLYSSDRLFVRLNFAQVTHVHVHNMSSRHIMMGSSS